MSTDINKLILKKKFKITSADCDMHARIRLGSYVNLLIQSAIDSAHELGVGFGDIMQKNLFWVLSRVTLYIYKPILWQENIEVETWPKTIDRLLYIRDYIIRNNENEIIARATSAWLAIDRDSKRPKVVDTEYAKLLSKLNGKHALEEMPKKLDPVYEGNKSIVTPSYFDYDLNNHVTATNYIDWMMDTFSFDFHEKNYPKTLIINYLKETLKNESVEITKQEEQNNVYSFKGTNLLSSVPAFRGKITF